MLNRTKAPPELTEATTLAQLTAYAHPRPTRHDDDVVAAAAKKMLPVILKWIKSCGEKVDEYTDEDREEVLEHLTDVLDHYGDGYELAQRMERHGYNPDAELVEIMDEGDRYTRDAAGVACKAWVVEFNVHAPPVGLKVRWPHKPEAGIGVVREHHREGTSTVAFADLGHGVMDKHGCGSHGYIIAWELLVPEPGQTDLPPWAPLPPVPSVEAQLTAAPPTPQPAQDATPREAAQPALPLTVTTKVNPWTVPEYIHEQVPPRPRQEGINFGGQGRSHKLQDVPAELLAAMCDQFRKDVFAKAGKEDPAMAGKVNESVRP